MIIIGESKLPHAVETTITTKLGRLPSVDFRDRQFLMSAPPASQIDRRYMHWITAKALDQYDTPHCVAYAGHQYLISSPVKNLPFTTTQELYRECQIKDEWEGENYDGTSVRALFKVLKEKGYVSEYRWAFDVDTVVRHVLTKGPVILGTNWDWDMFEPFTFGKDEAVFIQRGGGVAGGHAYLMKGVNLDRPCICGEKGAARIMNSWGQVWGDGGKVWMCLKDLNSLIAEWGEACTSDEIKFRPVDKNI